MPIDNFGHINILLVTENLPATALIQKKFEAAGGPGLTIETSLTSVIGRLQDNIFHVCYIDDNSIQQPIRVVTAIRNNLVAGRKPIVVFTDKGTDDEYIKSLYEAGTNYVVKGQITEEKLNLSYWLIDSLLKLLDKYRLGRERFFR